MLENLELGSFTAPASAARTTSSVSSRIFPRLKERLAQKAGTMSGGEQQMLAIGRGLMAEPQLLILDEPSLGLSPLLVEEMFALIAPAATPTAWRCCWWSRTWASRWRSPTAPTCWRTAALRFAGTPADLLASDELQARLPGPVRSCLQ